jgi:hypothetical protein
MLVRRLGPYNPLGEQRLAALERLDAPYLHFKAAGSDVKKSGNFAMVRGEILVEEGIYSIGVIDTKPLVVGSSDAYSFVPRGQLTAQGSTFVNDLTVIEIARGIVGYGIVTDIPRTVGFVADDAKVRHEFFKWAAYRTWDGLSLSKRVEFNVFALAEQPTTFIEVSSGPRLNRVRRPTGEGLLPMDEEMYLFLQWDDTAKRVFPLATTLSSTVFFELPLPHREGEYMMPPTIARLSAAVWLLTIRHLHPSDGSFTGDATEADMDAVYPASPLITMAISRDAGITWTPITPSEAPALGAAMEEHWGCQRRAPAEFLFGAQLTSFDGATINDELTLMIGTFPSQVWDNPDVGNLPSAIPSPSPFFKTALFTVDVEAGTLQERYVLYEGDADGLPSYLWLPLIDGLLVILSTIGETPKIYKTTDGTDFVFVGEIPHLAEYVGAVQFFDPFTITCNVYEVVGSKRRYALYESFDYGETWHFRATVYDVTDATEEPTPGFRLDKFVSFTHLRTGDAPAQQNPQAPWLTDVTWPIPEATP